MTRNIFLAGCLLAALAACGADGRPTPPPGGNVTISGVAKIGIAGGT